MPYIILWLKSSHGTMLGRQVMLKDSDLFCMSVSRLPPSFPSPPYPQWAAQCGTQSVRRAERADEGTVLHQEVFPVTGNAVDQCKVPVREPEWRSTGGGRGWSRESCSTESLARVRTVPCALITVERGDFVGFPSLTQTLNINQAFRAHKHLRAYCHN